MAYVKLFSHILDSTIWQTPLHVKITWITMLAMCDRDGEVHASVPGLAIRAGVSIEQCEEALGVLMSPDRYSSTPDHEGRRVSRIDGGWKLINHAKYRAKLDAEERRERDAERKRVDRSVRAASSARASEMSADVRASPDASEVVQDRPRPSENVPDVSHADQIRSDQKQISESEAEPSKRPTGAAARMQAMNETARKAVEAAARERRTSPPMQCAYPDHAAWCDLSRWALGVERNRPDVPAEEALAFALDEWLQTDAARHGFNPQRLASSPNEYFLREAIERRALGRELAARRSA